ncbi:MAG: CcmD family protein [Candidatus Poribacteria bacterium]|nr:CcmD family protein [Candidatus Poribacteria bacterium]
MRIIIIITFIGIFGLFLIAQIPVAITSNEVDAAVTDAIAQVVNAAEEAGETKPQIDEDEATKTVQLAIEQLESEQKRRLKFLYAAYLVIWLAIMLYVLRLGRQQHNLELRLSQLEQTEPNSQEEAAE